AGARARRARRRGLEVVDSGEGDGDSRPRVVDGRAEVTEMLLGVPKRVRRAGRDVADVRQLAVDALLQVEILVEHLLLVRAERAEHVQLASGIDDRGGAQVSRDRVHEL